METHDTCLFLAIPHTQMNLRTSRKWPCPFKVNNHKESNQAKFLLRILVAVNKNSSGFSISSSVKPTKVAAKMCWTKAVKLHFSLWEMVTWWFKAQLWTWLRFCLNGDGANALSNELNERFGNFHKLHEFSKVSKVYCVRLIWEQLF